jgi:hypothetical protein
MSSDGRYVVFGSMATNLVPGDTNNLVDVFVHDREGLVTTRVSPSSSGGQAEAATRGTRRSTPTADTSRSSPVLKTSSRAT